jgi:cytochrome P450
MRRNSHRPLRPHGPRGWPLVGNTLQVARDPLHFLSQCARDYGDIAFLQAYGRDIYLVSSPQSIREVLVLKRERFTLDLLRRNAKDALGNSVLVSTGAFWQQQHRLIRPAFLASRMPDYTPTIVDLAQQEIAAWQEGRVDIFERMSILTLQAAATTVLGLGNIPHPECVIDSLTVLMNHVRGICGTGLRIPLVVPSPGNLSAGRAIQTIDNSLSRFGPLLPGNTCSIDALYGMDDARHNGVMQLLCRARAAGVAGLTDRQVRDELVTLLLVGHETTALALTYALWLLAEHAEFQDEVAAEIRAVVVGKPKYDDIERLRLLRAVVHETLRLYPPVWIFGREAISPVEVDGYLLQRGAQVLVSPWILHRHLGWFSDPNSFKPERWLSKDFSGMLLNQAFIPFGGGSRQCVGRNFAILEIVIVLATVISRYRVRRVDDGDLSFVPTATLRPRERVVLELQARVAGMGPE